jgi:biopolymer transport protein ExbD
MSASSGGDSGQDFELNLAPIIDCFTVLITYLLVTASFLTLSMFEVGVAAVSRSPSAAPPPKTPPYSLSMRLLASKEISLELNGGPANIRKTVKLRYTRDGNWDFQSLRFQLQQWIAEHPEIPDATLNADPQVSYRELIKTIETVKTTIPKVYLAGQG